MGGKTTPARPPHDRRLGLCAASLTEARPPRGDIAAAETVRDEVERLMLESDYLTDAPFWWVTIAILYGLRYDSAPHYKPIHNRSGDLPLTIEVDVRDMIGASPNVLEDIFRRAVLVALIHAGRTYDRPVAVLERRLGGASGERAL